MTRSGISRPPGWPLSLIELCMSRVLIEASVKMFMHVAGHLTLPMLASYCEALLQQSLPLTLHTQHHMVVHASRRQVLLPRCCLSYLCVISAARLGVLAKPMSSRHLTLSISHGGPPSAAH